MQWSPSVLIISSLISWLMLRVVKRCEPEIMPGTSGRQPNMLFTNGTAKLADFPAG